MKAFCDFYPAHLAQDGTCMRHGPWRSREPSAPQVERLRNPPRHPPVSGTLSGTGSFVPSLVPGSLMAHPPSSAEASSISLWQEDVAQSLQAAAHCRLVFPATSVGTPLAAGQHPQRRSGKRRARSACQLARRAPAHLLPAY
jgi:hypothetical protein